VTKPTKSAAPTFPVPGPLGAFLNSGPLRAELVVTRADGGALTAADVALTERSLAAWEASEARRLPAVPGPAILDAVAKGGGLVPGSFADDVHKVDQRAAQATKVRRKGAPKPSTARKPPAKSRPKRAAAKRR